MFRRPSTRSARLFGKPRHARRSAHRGPRNGAFGRELRVEGLEERALLSVQPMGDEFRVNTYLAGDQSLGTPGTQPLYGFFPNFSMSARSTAMASDGTQVVVWTSEEQDGEAGSIFAQRIGSDGTPLGNEFRVNTTIQGDQRFASVDVAADGSFVVVWQAIQPGSDQWDVFGKRFDSSGNALGDEFLLHSNRSDNQAFPVVAVSDNGAFIVTYASLTQGGNGDILGQRFNSDGTPRGIVFVVNSFGQNNQTSPDIELAADGSFVITWSSWDQSGRVGWGVYAQRFDVNANRIGNEMRISGDLPEGANKVNSAVAVDDNGNFVVSWFSDDGRESGVFARMYDASAAPLGDEFRVNSHTAGHQYDPVVAFDSHHNFLIVWTSLGQDGDGDGVYGQHFAHDGTRLGSEFRINQTTASNQNRPSVTADSFGHYAVAWGGGADGDADVFTNRFSVAPPPVQAPVKALNEFRVNNETVGDQRLWEAVPEAVGMDADGDFVITWSSIAQDGDNWGVFAQRYRPDGTPAGAEFQVNTYTTNEQRHSTVAMDPDGDFVITWTSLEQDGSDYGIYARRYNAAGEAQGEEFRVNVTTFDNQRLSVVSMDAQGNFVIAWSELHETVNPDDPDSDVVARMFNADGLPLTGEIQVTAGTEIFQRQAAIARNEHGEFVIAWYSRGQDGDAEGIFAQRFAADGTKLGGEIQVNQFTTGQQLRPTVAIDDAGNFVVTWYNQLLPDTAGAIVPREIYARRFNANGTPAGNEFVVNTTLANDQRFSAVAMDSDGDFVITWMSLNQDGSSWGVYAQAFDAFGTKVGGEFLVNTVTANEQSFPSIGMDSDGDFVIAWMSLAQDGDSFGVYAQRYSQPAADDAPPQVANVFVSGDDHPIYEGERLSQQPSELVVSFSEDMFVDAGPSGANSIRNIANWRLTRNGFDVSGQIFAVNFGLNATSNRYEAILYLTGGPLTEGNYVLTLQANVCDTLFQLLDGNYDGVGGDSFSRSFTIALPVAEGPEFRVNTATAGDQLFDANTGQTVAMDDAGNFWVVWSSAAQDGSGLGVYVQRHDAHGAKLGSEFRANTYTTGDQKLPSVAVDPDTPLGDAVVVWTSALQDGSGQGVYAQRYAGNGSPLGAEFRVNTTTANDQVSGSVAMDRDGNFVVTWESMNQDGSGPGVYFQRHAADGTKLGGETRANAFTTGIQRLPNVAMDADGDFVITWTSEAQDGSGYGVYARRFTAAGAALGGEFRVNTTTMGNQQRSRMAMDDDGDFVITWQSPDGSDDGVFAQRYNAMAVAQGGEFRVHDFTSNAQRNPTVAMDGDGDFVIAWQSMPQDGSSWGVFAERYAFNGVEQGGEFLVNTTTAFSQLNPHSAMDPDGDFVLAWTSLFQDGSSNGIYAQRYAAFVNTPPVADAGGPYAIAEGDPLQLNGAGSFDPDAGQTLSYSWDLNNDGTFGDATGVSPSRTWEQLVALGIGDNGLYTVRLRVLDGAGGSSEDTASLTIANTAPSGVSLSPISAITEGGTATVIGSFVDPGQDQHTVTINWGDGSQQIVAVGPSERTFTWTHQYADDNPTGTPSDQYPVTVFVTDDDGASSLTVGANATVNNAAPQIATLNRSAEVIPEGGSLSINGSFTDVGLLDTHTVLVSWGDGTASTATVNQASRTFNATHVYGDDEPTPLHTITVTLTDDDGGATAAQTSVTVQNAAPVVTGLQLSANPVFEGQSVTLNGSFTDGAFDTHTVLVGWGDGTASIATLNQAARTFTATHTYAEDNATDSYAINVTVTDDDAAVGAGQTSITVENAAPSNLQIDPLEAYLEGSEITLTGRFDDPGTLDTYTITIHWGDGEQTVSSLAAGVREFSFPHTYLDEGPEGSYLASVYLVDDDGGEAFADRAISISNAPPGFGNLAIAPDPIDEGGTVTVLGTVVDPGEFDTHTVRINWGDGTESDAIVNQEGNSFTATHTYLDDNPSGTPSDLLPISITLSDDDGGTLIVDEDVTVENVAPEVSITGIPIVINVGVPFTLTALATDPSPSDTFSFLWQVMRDGVTVAAGAGEQFTFMPALTGDYLFRVTGTDDDLGADAAEIVLTAGPCILAGDTNGDCSVDLVDLNNVRNHFGETGLGAVDLSFNAPVTGTLLDKDGLGTGFTHRLPGTGGDLPVNDPNLDLEPGASGRLRIRSAQTNLHGAVNVAALSAPGVRRTDIGDGDFEVATTFFNVQVPVGSDQLMLYVGTQSDRVVRAGFHAGGYYVITSNNGGSDVNEWVSPASSFNAGDTVVLTFGRSDGAWVLRWENLTAPARSGQSAPVSLPWLDGAEEHFIGVLYARPTESAQLIAAIDNFAIDIRRPVPGDTNGDFVVDLVDLNAVRNNFGASIVNGDVVHPGDGTIARDDPKDNGIVGQRKAADVLFARLAGDDTDIEDGEVVTELFDELYGARARARRLLWRLR